MTVQHSRCGEGPWRPDGRASADYITRELSPTASRILEAAQKVLQREGYGGLTLQRVAAEAGEHKSLVIYHFGSKAALMTMLVDSLWHDLDVALFQSVESLPPDSPGRVSALIDAQRQLGYLTTQQQMYLDLFANLTRHRESRRHLAELNHSYRGLHQSCLVATELEGDELMALAGLVLAIGDGMAVSLLLRPDDIDDVSVYGMLEKMVLSLSGDVSPVGCVMPAPAADPSPARARRGAAGGDAVLGPDPLASLAPVARKLVRGARTVLRKGGFQALTLEAVGRAAGEPRSSITYYFGDKQGLVTALIEAQFYAQRKVAARILSGPGDGDHCAVGAVCATRELLSDMTSFRVFYDLLPVVARDPQFKAMQVEHDRWVSARIADGLRASDDPAVVAHADQLAVMELAAADGLAMQVLSDPKGFDPTPSCQMLERLVSLHLAGNRLLE